MKRRTRKATKRDVIGAKQAARIIERHIDEIANDNYYEYGLHTIEDRAIYCDIDGLKPVTRRSLWAAHKLGLRHNSPYVKSARVVGETMGIYHPHGDTSIYGAIVTAANAPIKMFDGDGNWGTMTDPPAAQRYTNVRLSKYSDLVFFDKFYLPVADMVENYDGTTVEPLVLPSLMPNALLNGNFGIAPGVRTQTPTIVLNSLVRTIVKTFKSGGKCTPELCMDLEFTTEEGGVLRRVKETKAELKQFFKTGKGKFTFDSVYKLDGHNMRFIAYAPFANVETVLTKVENIKGVVSTRDDSNKKDIRPAYVITLQKSLKGAALDAVIKKVKEAFSSNVSFNVQVTKRFIDPNRSDGGKKLTPSNIPNMINDWIAYRIDLEKRACTYWIGKRKKEIEYLDLMRLAVKNRRFIIQALDKKFDDEQLAKYIAKGLKITVEQANLILDLKIRQLKALEDQVLVDKIKKLEKEIAEYKQRIAKPKAYIARNIVEIAKELLK